MTIKAAVFYAAFLSGILTETDDGEYTFEYDEKYVMEHPKESISLTMPVRSNTYTEKRLFPFFDGLIPEGWLLDIASKNWKINLGNRMGLLLACCQNYIGAVSVKPIPNENE